LEVNGSSSQTYNGDDYSGGDGWRNVGNTSQTNDISIWANQRIVCGSIQTFSDQRLKAEIHPTDNKGDLQTLMGIEISDYQYKDVLKFGNKPQKKVVAQQVEKVYPLAVGKSTDVVPDIYRKATVKDGWVELATDLKAGDRVRLIGQKGEAVHGVLEVRAGAFRPDGKVDAGSLFVYGREVQDFRTVDYDAIAMLNVSATQELAKQLKEKDAKITAMAAKLAEQAQRAAAQAAEAVTEKTALQAQIAALQASGQTLEAKQTEQNAKLAALERLVTQQLEATPRAAAKNVVLQRAK
jgi:hypothetical protein